MAQDNQPKDDAKAMTAEYVAGVSINDIAEKYNHTALEVEQVVTTPLDDTDTTVTQAELDKQPTEVKKGK